MIKKKKFKTGTWITTYNPSALEIVTEYNFDWICIDIEHSPISFDQLSVLISIIQQSNIEAFVRVGKNDILEIKKTLDLGVNGIIVPMIKNEKDAINAVKYTRYPPIGNRSFGYSKANKYGINFDRYIKKSNKIKLLLQIEHVDAIKNLETILSVKNIDGTIIGPYDLSGSINQPGNLSSNKIKELIKKYEKISRKFNVPMGYHQVKIDHTQLRKIINKKYEYVCFGTDLEFLNHIFKETFKKIKK